MKLLVIIFLFIAANISFSQPTLQWAFNYHPSNNNNIATSVFVDDSGYVYSTGVIRLTRYKSLTVKQKPNGDTAWIRIDEDANADMGGADILTDSIGNVFVCGNPFLRKYDRNGNLLWRRYDTISTLPFGGKKILKDSKNRLIIGSSIVTISSYIVVSKLNPDSGSLIWRKFIYTESSNKPMNDIKLDRNDNIIVTGQYGGSTPPEYSDIIIAKLGSDGEEHWTWKYNGPGPPNTPIDMGLALSIDDAFNIYAACWSCNELGGSDFFTVKLNDAGGLLWTRRFNINDGGSGGTDIDVDKNGNVYVTGLTSVSNFTTLKYTNNGNFIWYRTLVSGVGFPYYPMQTLDTAGNIYLACEKARGSAKDLQICKYNSNGDQVWLTSYPGFGNVGSTHANKILTDRFNNVYVCGAYNSNFMTLKYSQTVNIIRTENIIPSEYMLYQNFPNPFNPSTKIKFSISENRNRNLQKIELVISDVSGREVEKNLEYLNAGAYVKTWEAKYFPSGVYFYSLKINDEIVDTKKMILLK